MLEVTKALNIKDKQSNDNMGMFFNCRVVKIFYFKAVKVITLKKKNSVYPSLRKMWEVSCGIKVALAIMA